MHQLVEYILGVALVGGGLQSPEPLVPSVLGGIVILYAACTRGSLSAFRLLDRRWHRVLDPVIVGLQLVGAAQPWISVDNGTRIVIAAIAAVHLIVWLGTSYTEKSKPSKSSSPRSGPGPMADADLSTRVGRSAGRMVGGGVKAYRRARAKRQ
jgi:hypothetical protein